MISNNGFPGHFKEAFGVGEAVNLEMKLKTIRIQKSLKRFLKNQK